MKKYFFVILTTLIIGYLLGGLTITPKINKIIEVVEVKDTHTVTLTHSPNPVPTIIDIGTIQVPDEDEIEALLTTSPEPAKRIYTITKNDVLFYEEQLTVLKNNDISNSMKLFKEAYSSATMEKMKKIDILVENKYIGKNSTILDFGCGNGRYTFKFSEIVGPDGKVYAVDQSINALTAILCLAQSAKQNTDNIIIKINNNYQSAVADEIIDLIFISDVHIFHYDNLSKINSEGNNFHYGSQKDQDKLLKQIDEEWTTLIDSLYNSTKKNGYLVVTEYMRCSGSKLRMSEKTVIRLFEKHKFKLEKSFTDSFKEEPIHYLVFKK